MESIGFNPLKISALVNWKLHNRCVSSPRSWWCGVVGGTRRVVSQGVFSFEPHLSRFKGLDCLLKGVGGVYLDYLPSILETHPLETWSILEMSQGRAPEWASSTIFCLVESGKGRPLTNTPPSWFTPLWPAHSRARVRVRLDTVRLFFFLLHSQILHHTVHIIRCEKRAKEWSRQLTTLRRTRTHTTRPISQRLGTETRQKFF